jgi:ketosteroid isomerase-like protein
MSATTTQEILRQEEKLAEAKRTLDLDALNRIYDDQLLMTGVLGEPTCTKVAIIDEAKRGIAQRESAASAGQGFDTSCTNEDVTVATHGDTAIANYRFVVNVTGPNVDVHRRYRTTNVWIKRDGRWRIIAAHTAFVLDPKQAARLTGEPH